jgi:hypothetical protein
MSSQRHAAAAAYAAAMRDIHGKEGTEAPELADAAEDPEWLGIKGRGLNRED